MVALVIESGEYSLGIDTGFLLDAFTLDDPVKGILAGYTITTTRTNLVTNPSFEVNTTGWTQNAQVTIARSTEWSASGSASVRVRPSTGSSDGYAALLNGGSTNNIAVLNAGKTYTISATCYLPIAQTGFLDSRARRILIYYRTGAGSYSNVASTQAATTGETRVSATITIPIGTTEVLLRLYNGATNSETNDVFWDAVLVEETASLLPYFDGTYADPYTGYTLTEQGWNGTANASTSTAIWGLTSSYIPSDYVLDGSISYAEVADSVNRIAISRGRRDIGDQFSAGSMSFTMLDTTGIFNPLDTDSPTFDPANQQPGLAPLREVYLEREGVRLFTGRITNYEYNFNGPGELDTVSVQCADDFYLISQTQLPEIIVDEELSSVRINAILDEPSVDYPTGAARNIATGTQTLGGHPSHANDYQIEEGTNTAAYIRLIQEAEQGRIFISADGVFTSQPRIGQTLSGSVADFHDDGTNTPYDDLSISFGADEVANYVSVQTLKNSSTPQIAEDLASQAEYFIQGVNITGSLLSSDASALTLAEYLLEPYPKARYTGVSVAYSMLTELQRDTLSAVEIGDTITISKTFPSGAGFTTLAQELSVEGIEHEITVGQGDRVRFYTAPTVIVTEFILDSDLYGVLDGPSVLG